MKQKLIAVLFLTTFAGALFAFAPGNSSYSSRGGASTLGQRTGTEPATGISRQQNADGVHDFKNQAQAQASAQATAAATPQATPVVNNLDEVVVTARRIVEKISFVPRNVEIIIPKPELRISGISELLDSVAGLEVLKYGGFQGVNTVSVRGAPTGHTLVMVDNIPINDIAVGTVDLTMIGESELEKIEVIQGGMSSIYGNAGSAGVINIITGSRELRLLRGSAAYGSFNTMKYTLGSDYKLFGVDYSVTGMQETSDGYTAGSDFYKRTLNAKLSFTGDLLDTTVSGSYLKRDTGVPFFAASAGNTPNARQYDENYSAGIETKLLAGPVVLNIAGFLRSADLTYSNPDPLYFSFSRSIKKEYQGRVDVIYDEGGFFSGLTSFEADTKSVTTTSYGLKTMDNKASISSVTAKMFSDKLVLNASFRADFNSVFANSTNESFSAKYSFPDNLDLKGSYEKSLCAPTFDDLYFVDPVWMMYGNPDLKPEETTAYEAGIYKKDGKLKESAVVFINNIKNLITWPMDPVTWETRAQNVNKTNIWGISAKVDFSPLDYMDAYLRYTYSRARDAETNKPLPYRPESKADAGVLIRLPFDMKISMDGQYVDARKDGAGVTMEPYVLLNAVISQKISANFSVSAECANILDNTSYEIMKGYKMPGRAVLVRLDVEL